MLDEMQMTLSMEGHSVNRELVEQMKELNRNLIRTNTLLSSLNSSGQLSLLGDQPTASTNQALTSGYVNWNSNHDVLKTEHWVKISTLLDFCRRVERGSILKHEVEEILSKLSPSNMNEKYVVDENTRFPKDDIYVNVNNPLVRAVILDLQEVQGPVEGLVDRFLNVAKSETHTFSSFEKEHRLKWVEPLPIASEVITAPVEQTTPVSRPLSDSTSEPVIPDDWIDSKPRKDDASEEQLTSELCEDLSDIFDSLTQLNFDTSLEKVKAFELNSEKRLELVADLLFQKALEKPSSSDVFAKLSHGLWKLGVPSDNDPHTFVNFRMLLIIKCQNFFENRKPSDDQVTMENKIAETNGDEIKEELQKKTDGNYRATELKFAACVKFIGELYKRKMLTYKIIDYVCKQLIDKMEENDLEYLCELLTIVGINVEREAKHQLNSLFKKLEDIIDGKHSKISYRVQSMIKDVIDLRRRSWIMETPRVVKILPKTLDEIQEESVKRALLIDLMNEFDVGGSGGDNSKAIEREVDARHKLGRNFYSVEALKFEATTKPTQNYIKLPPECFTILSETVLDNLKADPTSPIDTLTSPKFIPTEKCAPVSQLPLTFKLRRALKSLVDQYISNPDYEELVAGVKNQFPPQYHAAAVEEILNWTIDKNLDDDSSVVDIFAKILLHLVETDTISSKNFLVGLKETLDIIPEIDNPMLYEISGKIIASHIVNNHITLAKIFGISGKVISAYQGDLLLGSIVDCLLKSTGQLSVRKTWLESGLKFSQWMSEELVSQFITLNNFEFLEL